MISLLARDRSLLKEHLSVTKEYEESILHQPAPPDITFVAEGNDKYGLSFKMDKTNFLSMPVAKCLLLSWQAVHRLVASLEHLLIGGPAAPYVITFDKKLFGLGYQYASLSKLLQANSLLFGEEL